MLNQLTAKFFIWGQYLDSAKELKVHAHFRFPWTRKTEMNSIQLIENGQEENIFWQLQKKKNNKKSKTKPKTKTKQNNTRSYNKNNECIKPI